MTYLKRVRCAPTPRQLEDATEYMRFSTQHIHGYKYEEVPMLDKEKVVVMVCFRNLSGDWKEWEYAGSYYLVESEETKDMLSSQH